MIRVVLDTNVLASGFVSRRGGPGRIVDALRAQALEVVVSEHILQELEHTFDDRYFKKRLTKRRRKSILALLRRQAMQTTITAEVAGVAPSEEDDRVLATAKSAGASYLVTRDEAFLAVGSHEGIRIVTPEAFLAHLEEQR